MQNSSYDFINFFHPILVKLFKNFVFCWIRCVIYLIRKIGRSNNNSKTFFKSKQNNFLQALVDQCVKRLCELSRKVLSHFTNTLRILPHQSTTALCITTFFKGEKVSAIYSKPSFNVLWRLRAAESVFITNHRTFAIIVSLFFSDSVFGKKRGRSWKQNGNYVPLQHKKLYPLRILI